MNDPNEQPDAQEVQNLRAEIATMREKLAEEHKMASLGRLAAGIVHEVNTPIGSIFSNNEVLNKSLDKVRTLLQGSTTVPPKALDLLETMSSLVAIDKIACERITSIVRSMKTFARANDTDLRNANVNDILQNTIKLSSCVYRRTVTVVTDFGELPPIECYPGLLGQVFLNLIVNAAESISGEGKITVRSRLEGEQIHVSIADTGQGIKPEDRNKLFRTGFTTKPVGIGTGLGLTISREIIEDAHGGTIHFESEVGVGTTFHIRLPLVHVQQSDAATT